MSITQHFDVSYTTSATLINPSFSVDAATGYPAGDALEGNNSLTASSGAGICWSATISDGPSLVESVVITSVQAETYREDHGVCVSSSDGVTQNWDHNIEASSQTRADCE